MAEVPEAVRTLATLVRHQKMVAGNIAKLVGELEVRAQVHDQSKLGLEELGGFVEINQVAREHGIGTPKYEASLREHPCIALHFKNNSHHPEYHAPYVINMGWLDIIEMVLDWKAACDTYSTNSLRSSLSYQRERHEFTDAQWWLILQVVDWIEPEEGRGSREG